MIEFVFSIRGVQKNDEMARISIWAENEDDAVIDLRKVMRNMGTNSVIGATNRIVYTDNGKVGIVLPVNNPLADNRRPPE